jgi:integrase
LLTKTLHDKQKLSVATVKKAQFLLNQFFDYLKRENIVGENPVKNTVIKPNEEEKIKAARYKAIRPENRRDFFKAISTHPLWKPLCLTILFSSPRIGEILALKWRNLELDNPDYQGITIDSAVTIKYSFDDYGNVIKRERIIGTTKTAASERENPLPDIAVEALKEYKKYRALQASIYGYPYVGDDDFVFGNDKGQLRSYSGIRHMFTRFMKRHGLGNLNIHFHTLRHTFSNMLFESHENPKTIQALMGHKSEQTTKKTYHSVDRAQLNAATRTLNKLTKQSGFEM